MWKKLLWPEVENDADADTVTRQGFWLCIALSVLTLLTGLAGAEKAGVLTGAAFMFTAAIGVRNHSVSAAIAALVVFAGERLLMLRLGHNATIGITPFLITALLFANVRATWLAAEIAEKRTEPPPVPLAESLPEKFSDIFPLLAWRYVQWLFWPLTAWMALGLITMAAL